MAADMPPNDYPPPDDCEAPDAPPSAASKVVPIDRPKRERPKRPQPPPDPTARELTESGYAESVARTRHHDLRYVTSWDKWIAWDGNRWNLDTGRERAELAPKRIADALFDQARESGDPAVAARLAKAALKLREKSTRSNVVSLARWEPQMALHHSALDRDADHLLVTPSGTVDLRTGELSKNSPARLLTRCAATPYDPAATCPTWETFVREVSGDDPDLPGYLQRAAGYSLTGSIREHVLFFLSGSGANGKSTFVEAIRHVMGDYSFPLRSEALMAADHAQHPTIWAGMVGVRLAIASEIERGARLAESLVKSITGGDEIAARRMREDFWHFAPQFKLWLLGNDRPVVRGIDDGIWRRLRLVPFTVSFVGREDRDLPAKLRAEAPGILRWCVDGARIWYENGLREPSSIRQATEGYRAEQDVFGQWVADCLEVAPPRTIMAVDIRKSYETWATANGAHPIGPREFAARLVGLGAEAGRGNRGRYWSGVGAAREN